MRNPPAGWPRISSALYYQDAAKAIDWLCQAFGFEVQLKIEDGEGRIVHSELNFGGGVIMVAGDAESSGHPGGTWRRSPRSLGGANTQTMMTYVDDVDAHCAQARSAGAEIVSEPKDTDYGDDYWQDRGYEAVDLEGHHWWFYQRLRDAPK
jgi:uncharacterized glyoxalase superfamily protein PhnB